MRRIGYLCTQGHAFSVSAFCQLDPIVDCPALGCNASASTRAERAGEAAPRDEQQKTIEYFAYWLLRAYQSGHREGWEEGPSSQQTMTDLLHVDRQAAIQQLRRCDCGRRPVVVEDPILKFVWVGCKVNIDVNYRMSGCGNGYSAKTETEAMQKWQENANNKQ